MRFMGFIRELWDLMDLFVIYGIYGIYLGFMGFMGYFWDLSGIYEIYSKGVQDFFSDLSLEFLCVLFSLFEYICQYFRHLNSCGFCC